MKKIKIVVERNMDGTGPQGKGAKTGRGLGKCEGSEEYKKFFDDALATFAKKFGKKADINDFSDDEKKEFFDYVDKEWKATNEANTASRNYTINIPIDDEKIVDKFEDEIYKLAKKYKKYGANIDSETFD